MKSQAEGAGVPAGIQGRAVLTLATGNEAYFEMACSLARSFLWWNRGSGIAFYLATDIPARLPEDLLGVEVIPIKKGAYGNGFSPKLHMDRISPARETLFVDADCLCTANLEPVFERFSGCDVSVIGREETEGELFGDIAGRCRAVGVGWVPRFCGGLYFFRRGEISRRVFEKARELEQRYDELGLVRLRGVANEEPLIGLAMAIAGQRPIPEDGTIKAEPMFFSGTTEIDVVKGTSRLWNRSGEPRPYPEWRIPEEARPAIVHFNCAFAEVPPYTTEVLRLEKIMRCGWGTRFATAYAELVRGWPHRVTECFKDLLRPLYHAFFGHRRPRVIRRLK